MDYEVKIASLADKLVIKNLLQPYLEELTQYEPLPRNEKGEYEYRYLDQYWLEETRFPFLLCFKGEIAGFAFVRIDNGYYSIAEYYVKPEFRLRGTGFACAQEIIGKFKGRWIIEFYKENTARRFWRKVAKAQSVGGIKERKSSETHDCLEFSNVKMDIKAILFDIDDTLFDRVLAQIKVLQIIKDLLPDLFSKTDNKLIFNAFSESDRIVNAEFDAGMPSDGIRDRRNRLFLRILGLPESLAGKISEIYVRELPACDVPVAGAVQLVRKLSRKYQIGAVSNGLPDVQYTKLETLGLRNILSCIVLSEEINIRKPEVGIFLHAARLLGRKPEECLFVGDSYTNDIVGAKKAGMHTCWFNRTNSSLPDYEIKPDYVVRDLLEIPKLLK